MSELIHSADAGQVWCGDSLAGLPEGERWDLCCPDPPYSSRVHEGHDRQVRNALAEGLKVIKSELDYTHWGRPEVERAVELWHPRTRGWICVLTDHILGREWESVLSDAGRYVFPPLPCISKGRGVRLCGDGPSSWTVWLIVARPRHKPYSNWGTLPGYYEYPSPKMPITGGKPVSLMTAIASDYSRLGDLVADPTCGAGSCLQAAEDLGRRYWGMDKDRKHAEMAAGRMGGSTAMGPLFDMEG